MKKILLCLKDIAKLMVKPVDGPYLVIFQKVLFLLEGSRWRRDNETTTDKKLKEQKHKSHISYTTRITEEI